MVPAIRPSVPRMPAVTATTLKFQCSWNVLFQLLVQAAQSVTDTGTILSSMCTPTDQVLRRRQGMGQHQRVSCPLVTADGCGWPLQATHLTTPPCVLQAADNPCGRGRGTSRCSKAAQAASMHIAALHREHTHCPGCPADACAVMVSIVYVC
jgi:hypothetical protein